MKVVVKLFVFFILTLSLLSCNSSSPDELSASFDAPLINQSEALLQLSNSKSLITLNTKYFQTARKKNYKDGEALCYIYIASAEIQVGSYEDARKMLNRAKIILEKSDNTMIKTVFFHYNAKLNTLLDLYTKALDNNSKAIYYSQKIHDIKLRGSLLSKTYEARGRLLELVNKYDSALIFFHKALKIDPSPKIKSDISQFHLWHTKEMDSAFMYTTSALKTVQQEKKDDINTVTTYFVAATYYKDVKQYKKSKEYLDKALEIMDKAGNPQHFMYIYLYSDQMGLARTVGNTKEADYYYTKFSQAKDGFEKQRPGIANTINEEFISEMKKSEEKTRLHIILYALLLSILLLFISIYAYRQIRILKMKKDKLKDETEVLKYQVHDKRYEDLIRLAKSNDSSFFMKFKEVYPDLINNLLNICPDLENSELIFCAMLKLNFTSKEIATYLFILPKSVQQRKRRIRKRLHISSEEDIYDFIHKLG